MLEGRDDTDFPAVGVMNKVLVAGNDDSLVILIEPLVATREISGPPRPILASTRCFDWIIGYMMM
jgi:hypothetical protein